MSALGLAALLAGVSAIAYAAAGETGWQLWLLASWLLYAAALVAGRRLS